MLRDIRRVPRMIDGRRTALIEPELIARALVDGEVLTPHLAGAVRRRRPLSWYALARESSRAQLPML